MHELIKPLFVVCTDEGISATELFKHPKVIEKLAATLRPSRGYVLISLLSELYVARQQVGLLLLDETGIALLSNLVPARNSTQTAYIPARIWTYQVNRLKEFLDDFSDHADRLEDCYRFCLDAYIRNRQCGDIGWTAMNNRGPFSQNALNYADCAYLGPFRLVARRFGIEDLLARWVGHGPSFRVASLSTYMSLASMVGLLYTLNFSLMRAGEGSQLRADCFSVERDALGDDIHYVRGPTSKTIEDGDAHWIVSPSVGKAVEVMKLVARLRIEAAALDGTVKLAEDEVVNPFLQARTYEPWTPQPRERSYRKRRKAYGSIVSAWPKLFEPNELRITDHDLKVARQFTFNLDPIRFAVGKVWPLSSHQLRRTGAVNMLASGLVSDASLQYQLKHASRAMSRYYGQNYHRVRATIDDEARGYYLKEMYSTLARDFASLKSDRFTSPHGERRKAQILSQISEKDHKALILEARSGRVSYRENFMGGCAKPGAPCELGGISNLSGCMGYGSKNPCEHLLLDRSKHDIVLRLRETLLQRLDVANPESPLAQSLQAQLESIERAIDVFDRV